MAERTAVLYQTHGFDRADHRRFLRLQRECPPGHEAFVLMHAPTDGSKPAALESVPHHCVTTAEIRNPRYAAKIAGRNWRLSPGGNADLLLLHFRAAHPEFDRFWVTEYDVRFTGRWGTLFGAFADNDADLLATLVRRWRDNPGWVHWASLRAPDDLAPEERPDLAGHGIAAFLPVYRASARAVAAMDALYAQGWGGHYEATWPTLLAWRGLRIEDIGGDGEFTAAANRGRFYSGNPLSWDHGPGSFTYRHVRVMPGLRRNWLWHPVKPLGDRIAHDLWRARVRLERWLPRRL